MRPNRRAPKSAAVYLRLGLGSDQAASQRHGTAARRAVGMAAVLALPLIAWGFYVALGSPHLPSQPLAERLAKNPSEGTVEELVARAEAHLAANPEDGRGWDVLAPVYLRLGRPGDAVTAYRNAIMINGASAERESGLGEAIVAAADGMVSSEAQAAFERALALEGNNRESPLLSRDRHGSGRQAERRRRCLARIARTLAGRFTLANSNRAGNRRSRAAHGHRRKPGCAESPDARRDRKRGRHVSG